jgi:hypothetical protein
LAAKASVIVDVVIP